MEVVFLVVGVGELAEKVFRLRSVPQLLCQSAELRHAHTDDHVRIDGGHKPTLKLLIGQVLQGEQTVYNGSVHGSSLLF